MANTELASSPFFANAVHELRTPIQTIIGTLELMGDTKLDSEQTEYVRQVKFSADILLSLVNDLLDFSKIQSGKLKFESISVSPLHILESTVDLISIEAHNKGLEIVTNCKSDVPDAILSDSTRIQQVLLNLIKNAVKFTSKGYINVTLSRQGDNLLFEVIDTGIGVPEEKKQLIFKEFCQADASTTRKYGGTGLGLSICRNITNLFNGDIGIKDNPSGGAIFWFTVPIKETTEIPVKFDTLSPLSIDKDTHILIVDDSEVSVESTKYKLQKLGLNNVEIANSGEVAITKLREATAKNTPFSIAFIDMVMPKMDGWRLASEINADRSINNTKLFLVVPEGQMGSEAKMKMLDWFNGYVYKPIKQRLLVEALNSSSKETIDLEPVEKLPEAPKPEEAANIDCTVLVAEDHPINQKLLKTFLTSFGCTVYTANNGREAVEQVAEHSDIDIIFMDIQMPELNGIEATIAVRKNNFKGIIIACTANSDEADFNNYRQNGMNDVLVKPFKKQTVKSFIDKWLPVINIPDDEIEDLEEIIEEETNSSKDNRQQSLWNDQDFLDTVSSDLELAQQLIEQYISQTRTLLLNAKKALVMKNFQSLEVIGHTLKGSSATISAFELADIGKRIENATKNCDLDVASTGINEFSVLFANFELLVKDTIEEWKLHKKTY